MQSRVSTTVEIKSNVFPQCGRFIAYYCEMSDVQEYSLVT